MSVTVADLQPALQHLYEAFHASRPSVITGCPCCIDRKNVCTLTSKALGDLTDNDLAPYAVSVFLTVDGDDLRHFLPRIFELSATVGGWWPSPEVAIGKLRRANWESWSQPERERVQAFLLAWLERYLSLGADHADEIDSILCGIALSGEDLTRHLALFSRYPEALSAYRAMNAEALSSGGLCNAFWEEDPQAAEPIIQFLNGEA